MRIIQVFINAIFWIWLFIIPAGIFFFISFLLYTNAPSYLVLSVIMAALGIFLGVRLAEYVRKSYGLDHFFGKLLSSPELEKKSPNP